jgi:hypothetical protein
LIASALRATTVQLSSLLLFFRRLQEPNTFSSSCILITSYCTNI